MHPMRPVILCFMLSAGAAPLMVADLRAATSAPHVGVEVCANRSRSDISSVDFFLYFDTEEAARRAAAHLDEDRFSHAVKTAASTPEWLLFVSHQELPTASTLSRSIALLKGVAAAFDGRYEGHGCSSAG